MPIVYRLLIILSLLIIQLPAFAQPVLEEIVVTADYRQNNIDDIASSITIIDAETLSRKNAQHLEDVLLNAPNVNYASGSSRARFIQIRGIGERSQFSEPLNSSVGLLIDGIDFSGIGSAAMLYDMEQVEVLLGPQGTRYGSNALAGLINLQTRAPTTELSTGIQLQTANEGGQGIAAYISGPVAENFLFRLSAQQLESDGFSHNQHLSKATNQHDETTLRAKFSWLMSETEQLDFTAAMIDMDNGYDAFSLDNVRDTQSDTPGLDQQDSRLASFKFSSKYFDNFTLELLGGLANSDIAYGYDEDWVFTGFHPFEYSSTDHYFRDRETRSEELRLVSSELGTLFNGRTDWVAGIYSLQQDVDLTRDHTFLDNFYTSRFSIYRLAVYAETNTSFGEHWSLDFGLRSERFNSQFSDSNDLQFSPDDNLFGGKLGVNYQLDKGSLLYASASRGYKSGGFNTDGSLDADLREFNSETLWNYELGFKGALLNDRFHLRLALFYMDRDDVQISSSTVRVRNDSSAEFIDFIGNAAAGFNRGMELSSQWLTSDNITIYSSLGLLNSEYKDFINSTGKNLDGREQAHAPSYQFTLGTSIIFHPSVSLDINIQGRDRFYFSDSHNVQSNNYTLLNASLKYSSEPYSLTLWGRNLSDKDYLVRGFYFGNDPRNNYTAKGYTQLGEPARFGLTLNIEF